MKVHFIAGAMVLLFFAGCKEIEVPDMNIGGIATADIKKGLGLGKQVLNAAQDITQQEEYYIGRSVASSLLEKYKLSSNQELTEYINSVGNMLVVNSKQPEIFGGYHFAVLESNEINAFATPGGFVFVTRAIVKMCKNEDELAAVLAHEISHIQLRHGMSSIKDSRWTNFATTLGVEATKKYASNDLIKLTDAFGGSVSDVVNTLVVNGYSREYEMSADAYALEILSKTGYAPTSIVSMLEQMQKTLADDKGGFGTTHPKASERVESISKVLQKSETKVESVRTERFIKYSKNA